MNFDLIIQSGTVVDGSGAPGRRADVGIQGDRIVAIDNLSAASTADTLDASGLVVSPGFVDIHTHSDYSLLLDPRGESKVRQGVTTEVIGNCSFAPFPAPPEHVKALQATMAVLSADDVEWDWTDLEGYRRRVASQGAALNLAPLAGHSALRVAAMGYADRPARADELAVMERLLAETMEQGAFGLSVGLTLAPSSYAPTDEVVALSRVAARYGGYYAAHQRGSGLEARQESLEIGRRARIAVQLAHNNIPGQPFWHLLPEMLGLLERGHASGVDVTYDVYPYLAGMSSLDQMLPGWVQAGGVEAMRERLRDRTIRRRVYDELAPGRGGPAWPWDWTTIQVAAVEREEDRHFQGKTIAEVADMLGVDGLEAMLTLIERDHADAIYHQLSEENTRTLMRHPLGMIGSDGNAVTPGTRSYKGHPHPRYFGTFPRVLGRYVRDEGVLTLEEAIHKMTAMPAARVGLHDRGLLQPGKVADITLFNPATIADHATFQVPAQYATGIDSVLVDGHFVLRSGEMTGALPGQVLSQS